MEKTNKSANDSCTKDAKKGKRLTKQSPVRKRVLSFENVKDPDLVEQTRKHIEKITNEITKSELISLKKWCGEKGINTLSITRLLKNANLPIIRIGDFQGVYEAHLSRVIEEEVKRQVRLQTENRLCARLLTL